MIVAYLICLCCLFLQTEFVQHPSLQATLLPPIFLGFKTDENSWNLGNFWKAVWIEKMVGSTQLSWAEAWSEFGWIKDQSNRILLQTYKELSQTNKSQKPIFKKKHLEVSLFITGLVKFHTLYTSGSTIKDICQDIYWK